MNWLESEGDSGLFATLGRVFLDVTKRTPRKLSSISRTEILEIAFESLEQFLDMCALLQPHIDHADHDGASRRARKFPNS